MHSFIGYVRVSTDGQADAGGPWVQLEAIRSYVRTVHGRLSGTYFDLGIGGTHAEITMRGGWWSALAEASSTKSRLLVARIDRLARDVITQEILLAEVVRGGATVESVAAGEIGLLSDASGDPTRKLMRQIIAVFADYERSVIRIRMAAGRMRKRDAGGYIGGAIAYGAMVDETGRVVRNPVEEQIMAEALALRLRKVTWDSIGEFMAARGMVTRNGQPWNRSNIHSTLLRARARGIAPLGELTEEGKLWLRAERLRHGQ